MVISAREPGRNKSRARAGQHPRGKAPPVAYQAVDCTGDPKGVPKPTGQASGVQPTTKITHPQRIRADVDSKRFFGVRPLKGSTLHTVAPRRVTSRPGFRSGLAGQTYRGTNADIDA